MSKNVAVFVDVANLYYSARGQDVDVDYVALLKAATKGRDLIRAYAYSGLDPENENQRKFIDFLNKNGYKVLTKDIRKFGDGRVKANLDIELVVDLFRLADRMDIAVIVSGDGDFAPAIRALQDKGVRCEVISFRPNTSSDLIAVADEFIDVMKIAGIGRASKEARAQRGMSAPEMPAKEVVPEFGFREASPSVAKAALAALREGRELTPTNGDRGRGRRSRASTAATAKTAPPEEPAEALTAGSEAAVGEVESALEGEQRRRRRRRGGRGRGRGRARAAETTEAGAAGEEIGWVELDDVSQLAEIEGVEGLATDREYTFEEADEATLAELGLLKTDEPEPMIADEAAAEPADGTAAKKPARRRSRTTKAATKAASAVSGEAAPAEEAPAEEAQPKKPARRRTRSPKTPEETAPSAEAAPADEAPKRRTRSRKAKADQGSGEGSAEGSAEATPPEASSSARPTRARRGGSRSKKGEATAEQPAGEDAEGIWQRFRSARKTVRPS